MLVWKKRCKKDQTELSDRKIWGTKCGRYRVMLSSICYGRNSENPIPDTWYAMINKNGFWDILSKNTRTKNTTMKVCEKDAKEKDNPKKPKKRNRK